MAMDRVFNQKLFILGNEKGQSTVEYILLIAVIVSLVSIFFKSQLFQGYFGDNGQIASAFKGKMEYTYRHGINGKKFFTQPNYSRHESYNGRFFGAKETYP